LIVLYSAFITDLSSDDKAGLRPLVEAINRSVKWIPFDRVFINDSAVNGEQTLRNNQESIATNVMGQMLLMRKVTRGYNDGDEILTRPSLSNPRTNLPTIAGK
jgi:hypothetical protein